MSGFREWSQAKGGRQGVARWILVAARSSVSFGLALFAGVAALSAAKFIQEVPDVRLETQVARLVDASATSSYPQPVQDAVEGFNKQVRESVGEHRSNLTLKQVLPSAADGTSINPDTVGGLVAYSQELHSMALFTGSTIEAIPSQVRWKEVEGCDVGAGVLNTLYGPVACLTPSGDIQPFGESAGVPAYAQEIVRLPDLMDVTPRELRTLLEGIDDGQYFEAHLVVFNDGGGSAQGVQIAAPEDFAVDPTVSVENRCPRSGRDVQHHFSMPPQSSCELVYTAKPTADRGLEDISNGLVFSASASNSSPLADIPLNWILVGVGLSTLVYLCGYLFSTFSDRIEAKDLK